MKYMKSRLTTLLPVALCLILSSCGADGLKTIDIARGLRTEADTLGLEALAGDVRAIELKCDSLYDIRIFGAHDGRLYGRSADNVIAVMDESGNMLCSFGRTGRGPGEYVSIASIEYDPFNDEIVVLDAWNKVLRFSPDGTLIDETRNNTISTLAYIMPLDKNTYVATVTSYIQRDSCLLYLDRDFNVTGQALPIFNQAQLSAKGLIITEGLSRYNSTVMYRPYAEDTYYAYSDGSWTPYMRIEQGSLRMSPELMVSVDGYQEQAKYIFIQWEFICGRYCLINYVREEDMAANYDVYDMNTGKLLIHNVLTIDDIDSGLDGFIFRYGGEKHYIIPGFIDGNVMYCSLPQDDGGTTLLRITL